MNQLTPKLKVARILIEEKKIDDAIESREQMVIQEEQDNSAREDGALSKSIKTEQSIIKKDSDDNELSVKTTKKESDVFSKVTASLKKAGVVTMAVGKAALEVWGDSGNRKIDLPNPYLIASSFGVGLGSSIINSLANLFKHNKVVAIQSEEELVNYINAMNNRWITDGRQWYVFHPKKERENFLIESQNFYEYIEQEQYDEIVDYIFDHCPVKSIKIDREELSEFKASGKGVVKGAFIEAEAGYELVKGNYYTWNSPHGVANKKNRTEYLWLEKHFMESVAQLTEEGSFSYTYNRDFTFGITVKEARILGLDISKHKKYQYKIEIKC